MGKISVPRPCLAMSFAMGLAMNIATAFAADVDRIVKTATYSQTQGAVVVAEGDLEPRSIGSYSVRLYAKNDPAFPYDSFITGTVRPRDGSIENVRFADLDRDGIPEILVIMRAAGSGGFLSADAFRFQERTLTLLTSVSGIEGNADPVRALASEVDKR